MLNLRARSSVLNLWNSAGSFVVLVRLDAKNLALFAQNLV